MDPRVQRDFPVVEVQHTLNLVIAPTSRRYNGRPERLEGLLRSHSRAALETEAAAETRSRAGMAVWAQLEGIPRIPALRCVRPSLDLARRPRSRHSTGCREEGGPGPRNIWQPINLILTRESWGRGWGLAVT